MSARASRLAAVSSLLALVVLSLAWELALAPLRPGGSWVALKALPLLFALRGAIRGDVYTFRWSMMLVLAYVVEGIVRAYSEPQPVRTLAAIEIALATAYFVAAIAYIRLARK